MAKNANGSKHVTMKPVAGRPGLFTITGIARDERSDKRFIAKVLRDARNLKARILASS